MYRYVLNKNCISCFIMSTCECIQHFHSGNIFQNCDIPYVPLDIRGFIWKKYFSSYVLKEIHKQESIWHPLKEQSQTLIDLCVSDKGSLQFGHFCFDELLEKHKDTDTEMWMYLECLDGTCLNCIHNGFPCLNMTHYGLHSEKCKYSQAWKSNL